MRTRSLILLVASAVAFGQGPQAPDGAQGSNEDPPSRAAQLGFLSGSVTFQPGGVEDWIPATLNRPLTTGDRLFTDNGARAEMHLGSAAFRLNGRTNFAFLNLDDRTAQIQLSLGSLSVRVRKLADEEVFEIDTPQAAFSLLRPGEYRFEVNDQGDATIVTVRGGQAEATAAGQAFTIQPREQVRVSNGSGDGAPPVFDRRPSPPGDAFDNWCQDRDRREDMSQSARYVSRDMPGYADLDAAGTWRTVPDYGAVWVPGGVPVGWAPYHNGHWAWIAPWGWTWVDDAPWGYAPFHYGRWAFVAGGWGWIPGPIAVRPMYAPALVAWVGGGGFSVGVGIGGPAVGWFALGPREVFVPAYHYSPRYIEQVNVTNTVIVNRTVFNNVNVTNVTYVNRGVAGAVTVVPQGAMAAGRPVAVAAVRVQPEMMARAQVTAYAAVAPEHAAVLGGRAAVSVAPPAAIVNRTVVARAAPPARPMAFEQQQGALRANPGRPPQAAAMRAAPAAGTQQPAIRSAGVPVPNANRSASPQVIPQNPARPMAQPGNPNNNRNVTPSPQPAREVGRPQGGAPQADRPAAQPRPQLTPAPAAQPNRPTPAVRLPAAQPNRAPAAAERPQAQPRGQEKQAPRNQQPKREEKEKERER